MKYNVENMLKKSLIAISHDETILIYRFPEIYFTGHNFLLLSVRKCSMYKKTNKFVNVDQLTLTTDPVNTAISISNNYLGPDTSPWHFYK